MDTTSKHGSKKVLNIFVSQNMTWIKHVYWKKNYLLFPLVCTTLTLVQLKHM
ncbi:hypothetical protein MTR_6g453360 [Medicago truncatula]|uniref:Uncharacterized protein n=1 Tax=Medicago truncatula TaxID=3880 RepID=A0A072UKL9_MEDTR|nr:hypothetical protein MTR_6g453360 [Medicago truncatula]